MRAIAGSWARLGLAAVLGTAAAPAWAATASGGMPQLNPNVFTPQLFWLAVIFVALYWIMSRTALPRVAAVLEARQQRISQDLDQAAALKAKSDEVIAAYEKSLAQSRAQAQNLARQTQAEMAAAAAARQSALAAETAQRLRAAEQEIRQAKAEAMSNIASVAAEAAREATQRLTGVAVPPEVAEAAARAALAERT